MEAKPGTPTLPSELWAKIFTYLPFVDLIRTVLPVSKAMEPKPGMPTLPPELWAKIFTYLPPVDLIRTVLPVSKEFRHQAYFVMRDVDWFQDWGVWYNISHEFIESVYPPKTLNLDQHVNELDRLVKQFPSVSKLSLYPECGCPGLRKIGAEMRDLVEFRDEAPRFEREDLVKNTLLKNPSLKSLSLSNLRPTDGDPPAPRLHAGIMPHHLSALKDLPLLSYLSVDCEFLEPDSFQALNAYPALTQLKLTNLTQDKFSGLAQGMSAEMGQRLSLAHLSGDFGKDSQPFWPNVLTFKI